MTIDELLEIKKDLLETVEILTFSPDLKATLLKAVQAITEAINMQQYLERHRRTYESGPEHKDAA